MRIALLNEKFNERMKNILGEDYPRFANSLEEENVKGLRINRVKCPDETAITGSGFALTPLSYVKTGFILESAEGIGLTPEHHAGMIYIQDPGAMATVASLDIKKGAWALDMCSAPGGKATQLSDMVGEGGFVFCNEFVPKRAKIIVANLERLGIKNAIVTSLDTVELKKMFRSVFDVVLLDAPCSGEGMFRKSNEAKLEWSEENVLASAKRQRELMENAAPLVKDGGHLIYSTCTYSKEENEDNVLSFLKEHPEFELCEVKEEVRQATADGLSDDCIDLKKTRRFYPHISRGEGQYVALMRKKDTGNTPTFLYKDSTKPLSKKEATIVNSFLKDTLSYVPEGKVVKHRENIVLIEHGCPVPENNVFMSGTLIGEIKGELLFPSHQFFSVYGKSFKRQEMLLRGDARVPRYLRGEEIEATDKSQKGYCAVIYEGAVLGGGKISGGTIKNHYPKGLRNK